MWGQNVGQIKSATLEKRSNNAMFLMIFDPAWLHKKKV